MGLESAGTRGAYGTAAAQAEPRPKGSDRLQSTPVMRRRSRKPDKTLHEAWRNPQYGKMPRYGRMKAPYSWKSISSGTVLHRTSHPQAKTRIGRLRMRAAANCATSSR